MDTPPVNTDDELSPELKRAFRFIMTIMVTVITVIMVDIGIFILEGSELISARILPEQQLNYKTAAYARHNLERSSRSIRLPDGRHFPINAQGMRGPETTLAKPVGTTRVLIYGGSHVFDQNVSGLDDWPSLVENALSESGLGPIEVLNAGTPGHSSTDAVGKLLTEGHYFQSDYVLFDYGWNDLKNFTSDQPVYRQQVAFTESYRTQYRNGLDELLCRYSRLYLGGRWFVIAVNSRIRNFGKTAGAEGLVSEGGRLTSISDRGRQQYELNLRTFISIAKATGAQPVLVTQPTLVNCDNTEEERSKIAYNYINMTHELLCAQYAAIHETVRRVGLETQTPVIDVASSVESALTNFTDHVHSSPEGSKRIASAITKGLTPLLKPEPTEVVPELSQPELSAP